MFPLLLFSNVSQSEMVSLLEGLLAKTGWFLNWPKMIDNTLYPLSSHITPKVNVSSGGAKKLKCVQRLN